LTRGDPRALALTDKLFDLFSDEAINWDAASSIGKIAAATDVLTKTNYVVTKFLSTQKFTNGLLPRLMKNAQESSGNLAKTLLSASN